MRQDVVIVAAIGRHSAVSVFCKALSNGCRHQRSDGAQVIATAFPVKPIVLPFIAEDLLGILVVVVCGVFLLRRHKLLTNTNGRHFIPTDPPIEDFMLAGLSIEVPRTAL